MWLHKIPSILGDDFSKIKDLGKWPAEPQKELHRTVKIHPGFIHNSLPW